MVIEVSDSPSFYFKQTNNNKGKNSHIHMHTREPAVSHLVILSNKFPRQIPQLNPFNCSRINARVLIKKQTNK